MLTQLLQFTFTFIFLTTKVDERRRLSFHDGFLCTVSIILLPVPGIRMSITSNNISQRLIEHVYDNRVLLHINIRLMMVHLIIMNQTCHKCLNCLNCLKRKKSNTPVKHIDCDYFSIRSRKKRKSFIKNHYGKLLAAVLGVALVGIATGVPLSMMLSKTEASSEESEYYKNDFFYSRYTQYI